MNFIWVTLPIAILALAVFVWTMARHWKKIRLLDPESIKDEKYRQKRNRIIEQRFDRMRSSAMTPVKIAIGHAWTLGKASFHAAYLKLIRLDRFYRHGQGASHEPSVTERLKHLLDEGRSLTRDQKWAEAERRFLDMLTIDQRNVDAYKGLANVYLKQKQLSQAEETYEFLLKLNKADDVCYAGLGEIAEEKGDTQHAEEYYKKAVAVHPKTAHWHAVLAAFYQKQDRPQDAWESAKMASELERGSQKYLELSLEAAIRAGQRDEARRRYDKLRLNTDDRLKVDGYKQRLEEMR